jgi:hypothetical protein
MSKSIVSTAVAGALLAGFPGCHGRTRLEQGAQARHPCFPPGVTPIEWATKKSDHSGSAGMRKGETCAGCHEEKGALNFNFKRLADKELEPKGAPKTMTFPVSTQVAYDAANLYIRLTFKAPVRRRRQGRQGQRGQGDAAVRRCQGAAGSAVRLLAELPQRCAHHAGRGRQEDQVHQGRCL